MQYGLDERVRRLLDAVLVIASDLDLPAVLRRIVQSAMDLVQARYGALGVLGTGEGRALAEFISIGIDDETYRLIGDLPHGRGILGLLIDQPKALRLVDSSKHP